MNYRIIVLFSSLLISCSLFDNEQQIILDEEFIVGEWVYQDFSDELNLIPFSQVDTTKLDDYIYYNFKRPNKANNGLCEIKHSDKSGTYRYCHWRVDGDGSNLNLSLQYLYFDEHMNMRTPTYLYKVGKLNQNSLNLDYIFQGPTEDTFIPEDQEP